MTEQDTLEKTGNLNQAQEEDIPDEPLKVTITNPSQEKDLTSWEESDPWEFTTMTEEDIKEAEEARNA